MTYLILFLIYSPVPNNWVGGRRVPKVLIKRGGVGPTDNLNINKGWVQIKGGSENCSENSQSLEILNAFYTLTVKLVFSKTQTLFKKLEYCFFS